MYKEKAQQTVSWKDFVNTLTIKRNTPVINNFYSSINSEEFAAEAKNFFEPKLSVSHAVDYEDILEKILEKLQPVNFSAEAELKDSEKVSQKHYIVITIRQILKTARSLNVDLCSNQLFLYIFDGTFWNVLEKEQLETFLGKCACKLGVAKTDAEYYKFISDLYKQFLAVASKPRRAAPSDIVLINLQNGTFEVSADKHHLRAFRREDFLTYRLNFAYDKTETCPKWKTFLDKVLPDESCQNILAEYLGYVFARHLKLEKTLILYGTGANGKSVIFDVVNAMLGKENVSNYTLESLGQEYHRAMLADKLLNYASEISNRLQTEKFKQLTSGEPIEARHPYGRPLILNNYARLAFNCNELPKDVEHTEAFFRRFLIIPFNVTIPEAERNPNLAKEIIEGELAGVFNWVLEGLQRILIQSKFSYCRAAQEILDTYKKESDSVAMFLEDENYKPSTVFTTLKDLYQEYKFYCTENGRRALGRNNFGKRLESNGFSRQDRNQPVFYIEKTPRVSI